MNKIIMMAAAVLAAAAFVPEAAALPSFARQTGMACSACHQQHFPILNKFGREFKASGYTMMGAQGKVEGDHLSIPDTLNGAILVKVKYQKDNTAATDNVATGTANTLGDGQLQFGDELSLFFGGRVGDNIGFMFEGNTVAVAGSLMAGLKIPIMFDAGETRLSVIPFTTDTLGVQYGYELSSGGVMRANRWAEHRRETSAVQYNADQNNVPLSNANTGAATGFALVAQNDIGYINFTKWSPNYAMGGNGSSINSFDMSSRYFRVAATPSVRDWDMVVGFGVMGGESQVTDTSLVPPVVASLWETRQTFADFQAHGSVGNNDLGVYAQYAKAPVVTTAAVGSIYGAGTTDRKAFTLGADYSVIPNVLSFGAAYRKASNGAVATANGDDALTFTAVYDLAMNVALHANYSKYKGTSRNAAGDQTSLYTLQLEAGW
ncbi:MAG: hypothetical protein ACOY9D_06975 [Pseudomonadota bacterium]